MFSIIEIIHLIIFFYIGLGGYLIPIKYLPIFLLTLPYNIIDWNDRDKLCWITKLTNMIKYKSLNPVVQSENENYFVQDTLNKFGIHISSDTLTYILYVFNILSWCVGFIRLLREYKITIFPNRITQIFGFIMIFGYIIVTYI